MRAGAGWCRGGNAGEGGILKARVVERRSSGSQKAHLQVERLTANLVRRELDRHGCGVDVRVGGVNEVGGRLLRLSSSQEGVGGAHVERSWSL